MITKRVQASQKAENNPPIEEMVPEAYKRTADLRVQMRLAELVEPRLLPQIGLDKVLGPCVVVQIQMLLVLFRLLPIELLQVLVLLDDSLYEASKEWELVVDVGPLYGHPVEWVAKVLDRFDEDPLDLLELAAVALK